MAAIKFDQLDPEMKRRVLEALEEQAGEAATGNVDPPLREPAAAKVGETPAEAAAALPGMGDGAPRSRPAPAPKVGEGGPRPPGGEPPAQRYFVAEPLVVAWIVGLLLSVCWCIFAVAVSPFGSSFYQIYQNGYAVFLVPVFLLIVAWGVFWRKILIPQAVEPGKTVLSFVVMLVAFYLGIVFPAIPTGIVIVWYLFWQASEQRQPGPVPPGRDGLHSERKPITSTSADKSLPNDPRFKAKLLAGRP